MAFPAISDWADDTNGAGTSHTVTMPANISAGDLLIVIFCTQGTGVVNHTWPGGWNVIGTSCCNPSFSYAYRIADGTEGATITVDSSQSRASRARAFRITGWHGTTPPEGMDGGGTTSGGDAPGLELTPSWGSADTLWIAAFAYDDANTNSAVTAYPTNYTLFQHDISTGNLGLASAARQLAAAADQPDVFSINDNETYQIATIGVRPVAATAASLALPSPARRAQHFLVR